MKDIGIIRDNTSSFAFPVVLVKKNNGSWRLYVDYRHLNRFSIKDKFHIPFVEELLDELVRACYFSKIYLKLRYHQIWMHKSNIHKTVFKTHHNHYELLVMSFGLINAPTFQSLMNHIFQPHLKGLCWSSLMTFWYTLLIGFFTCSTSRWCLRFYENTNCISNFLNVILELPKWNIWDMWFVPKGGYEW